MWPTPPVVKFKRKPAAVFTSFDPEIPQGNWLMHANFRLHATRIAPLTVSSVCFDPGQKMTYWLVVEVACHSL